MCVICMCVILGLVTSPNKESLICKLADIRQIQCYCVFHYDGFKRVSDIKKKKSTVFYWKHFPPLLEFVIKYQIQSEKQKGTISLCFQLSKYVELTLGMRYTKAQ